MNKNSILHIPMSQYAHGVSESRVVFRLRSAKGDLDSCTLNYGDTACRQTPITFYKEPMRVVASDEFYDYYEIELDTLYHRIYYYFELSSERETVYYYSDFFRDELVDDRSEYYKLPYNHKGNIATIPDWVNDAVIYNIFPDSFATGHRYTSQKPTEVKVGDLTTRGLLGGTIKGIADNVDYLVDLGINCIYINPIFTAGEYHKYDTIDYLSVDPNFGTDDDFKEMVKTLHAHDVRVIIDGVFNHCGWHFFAFDDVVKNGEKSKYTDWFYRLNYPVIRPNNPEDIPSYECFAYERMMPKLDTTNDEVLQYMLDVGTHWVKEYDIDGWRLDVASEVDDRFWREFRNAVKGIKPDAFIIGEVWESAGHWLDGSQFDSTMNYDLRKHCKYFFADQAIDAGAFDARITNMRMRYNKHLTYAQLNLLDSHDVSRFLSVAHGDTNRFELAVLFQMMFVGAPSIFYGDEQGLMGTDEPGYRQAMKWNTEQGLYKFYKTVINLRKSYPAITVGEYRTIYAESDSMLYVFERFTDNENILVIMNASEEIIKLPFIYQGDVLFDKGLEKDSIDGYGYGVIKGKRL